MSSYTLNSHKSEKSLAKGTQSKSPMPRLKSSNGRPLHKSNSTAITYCGTL